MNNYDERVRQRAYRLWVEEGCPEGRADAHWDKARELVAIEQNQKPPTKPVAGEAKQTREPGEPAPAMKNLGEFPTLTDQGKGKAAPERAKVDSAAAPQPAGGKAAPPKKAAAPRATAAAAARQASGKKASDAKSKAPGAKPH